MKKDALLVNFCLVCEANSHLRGRLRLGLGSHFLPICEKRKYYAAKKSKNYCLQCWPLIFLCVKFRQSCELVTGAITFLRGCCCLLSTFFTSFVKANFPSMLQKPRTWFNSWETNFLTNHSGWKMLENVSFSILPAKWAIHIHSP